MCILYVVCMCALCEWTRTLTWSELLLTVLLGWLDSLYSPGWHYKSGQRTAKRSVQNKSSSRAQPTKHKTKTHQHESKCSCRIKGSTRNFLIHFLQANLLLNLVQFLRSLLQLTVQVLVRVQDSLRSVLKTLFTPVYSIKKISYYSQYKSTISTISS